MDALFKKSIFSSFIIRDENLKFNYEIKQAGINEKRF